jgi:GNAT superfamily N-acetyltransferase
MARRVTLPEGFDERSLTLDDVEDVIAMINDCERLDIGELMWEREDLVSDAASDGFDPTRDWIGVFRGDRVVAWAMALATRRTFVDVHPDVRGRGIGTHLRSWTVERARQLGCDRAVQTVHDGRTDVIEMLRAAGYTPRHTSWVLRMDHAEQPPAAAPPDGIEIRTFVPADEERLHTMFEEAFSEFTDRLPQSAANWRAMTTRREGFRNEDMIVAADGDRIVGGAFLIEYDSSIWVDKFAVDRDYRRRGIARAMLFETFRRSSELGSPFTELNTDSRTAALPFYERIGMYVRSSYTNWGLDL